VAEMKQRSNWGNALSQQPDPRLVQSSETIQ